MGAACCVAARDRTVLERPSGVALHRNIRYSPSWSFRWDNRGRVAGEVENPPHRYCHGNSVNEALEIKRGMDVDTDISEGGSPLDNFSTPSWRKFPIHEGAAGNLTTPASDLSMGSSFSTEVKDLIESSAVVDPSTSKPSFSVPSTSMSVSKEVDPISSHSYPIPDDSTTSSRRTHSSPRNQFLGRVSDGRILGLKSPNNSVSEGRESFVLSTCSNDLTLGSHGGSSDGWSMRTFSELVASSQRDRWSFDSETLDSSRGKITRTNSCLSASPSNDLQTCSMCAKPLTERSSWSSQKILANNELSVVAVLVCGHVYHAECLENMTTETDKFDPSCPACSIGEKQFLKMTRKVLKAEADLKVKNNRISRNRVVDSDVDDNSVVLDQHRKAEGKGPKMGASSSMKASFAKPFLRRHFSLGSKSTRALSMNDVSTSRKKGFWARYRKE